MKDCRELFYLCLTLCGVILSMLAMFFGYNLKLSARQAELKKEIQEVERVNGKEKRDIKQLQEQMKEIKEKINHDER